MTQTTDLPVINLLYSGNYAAFDGILSSLISVIKYNPGPLHVFLFTMDLRDRKPNYLPLDDAQVALLTHQLQTVNPASTCTLIDLTETFLKDEDISIGERFTPYALLRLYADQVAALPDKILYLDIDTLVLGSLQELYATNLSGYEFAACKDYFGHWFFGWHYCNSGVLLLNLPQIRQTGLLQKVRTMCRTKNLFLADQTALNKCATKKLILHPRYNRQRRLNTDTVIRHYCASWRFFPYIRLVTVKQWELDQVTRDRKKIYCNPAVAAILQDFQVARMQLPTFNEPDTRENGSKPVNPDVKNKNEQ